MSLLHRETRAPTPPKNSTKIPTERPLKPGIPVYGPKFIPPTFNDARLRMSSKVKPQTAYLRPVNVVHPVYYPNLRNCPHCGSDDVRWDSWNGTGSREVHGLRREETALGYQLRHDKCIPDEGSSAPKSRSFATTNQLFWQRWEHWKIPRGIPYFFSRCAVARDLFDLIIEFRPSTTSGGLAENIKQYHEHSLEYLQAYQRVHAAPGSLPFSTASVEPFSAPTEAGYNDTSITDDMVREVYMAFVERTRGEESDEYLRNLDPGVCLSADNTFKAAGKATVVDASKTRTKLMKGGILSVLNAINEIIAWRFCQSASPAELYEVLLGIKKRCEELGIDLPEMIVVDNCCQVEKEIHKALPDIQICLNIYHFMMRYLAAIINGTNNPHRSEVAAAIRNAVLKNSASKGVLAQYWSQEEQEANMIEVYNEYCRKGGVWSAAAHSVHMAQLKHLRRGCLSRRNQDVASDGSRIEGSHKGWNSLQRASASGLELQNALSHDFVLRRNIRIAFAKKPGNTSNLDTFVRSTFGSHHSRLVNHTASVLNSIMRTEAAKRKAEVPVESLRPMLKNVASGEVFGLVASQHNDTFGGMLTIKSENVEDDQLLNEVLETSVNPQDVLADLNIDPALLLQPLQAAAAIAHLDNTLNNETPTILLAKRKEPEPDTPSFAISPTNGPVEASTIPKTKKQRISEEEPVISTAANIDKPVHSFFSMNATRFVAVPGSGAATASQPSPAGTAVPITALTKLLPLPAQSDPTAPHLTRSEQLFARATGTNPKSLEVGQGKEFFLFMDMRGEFGWKSSDMTSKKWVQATSVYNERLGADGVAKSPRALSIKLGEMERVILNRIATKTFTSQKGDDKFWTKHCFSVALVKVEAENVTSEQAKSEAARAVATCQRCCKIMYPGPKKSPENHKRGYCSDGFKQKVTDGEFAPWPQPDGLFTTGSEFHPLPFLSAIREVYEKVVVEKDYNISMEHEAFLGMLRKSGRIIKTDSGAVLFKLFTGFTIPSDDPTPEVLFVEITGTKYLRIDALRDVDVSITSDLQ
ncbi:hypothetical protein FB451DRAFT_1178035 [Mycena latifolia]|nr:hypothetical protein FB451DRAFT_1178035 [Mycena latifolia]